MNGEEKILELMSRMYTDLKSSQEEMYSDLKSSQEKMYSELKSSQEKMYSELKSSQEVMYAEMTEGFKVINKRLDKVEDRQERFENEVKDVKKTVLTIEQEHGKKLSALFDGHMQIADKLDRIETQVKRHDDFILKKVT